MEEYIYATDGKPIANENGRIMLAREKIIRCGECARFIPQGTYNFNGIINKDLCHIIRGFLVQINPDGFCAWGERISE